MQKWKALLVGAGGMGKAWAKNLAQSDEVACEAWVDIRPGAAAAAIEEQKFTGVAPHEDLNKALAELKPDFVVDVTIPEAHYSVTLAALKAGAHVLGEKPMANSMQHAREMVAAADSAGRLYMVSQSRRYDPLVLAFMSSIREHAGDLGMLKSDFYLGPHFGGFREQMDHVLLLDMAIHTFDNARQISGADPISVYAEQFNPAWSWFKHGASATALFEMTGGIHYTYCGSWCAQGQCTSWQSQWRAYGSRGSASWDGEHPPTAERVTATEGFMRPVETIVNESAPEIPRGIAGSLAEFLTYLKTGKTPQGECHDNIKSLAMVFAAIESAAAGRRVKVSF